MVKKDQSSRGDDSAAAKDEQAAKAEEGKVNADDIAAANSNSKLNYKPTRRALHKLFIIIAVLTSLCALWMIAVQVLGFVVYENGPVDYVLRSYIIVFCVLVVLVELEWPARVREAILLHYWITRGLLYVFIGVLGLQESDSEVKEGSNEFYATMLEIAKVGSWNMIGCGLLYFVMGVLCLQLVLKRMRKSYQDRLAQAKGHSSSEKQVDSGEDAEDEGVEVAFGEDVEDAHQGDESDVEKAQDESVGEEKTDAAELESNMEKAQDESTAEVEAKSSLTSDEKEGSDGKSSA